MMDRISDEDLFKKNYRNVCYFAWQMVGDNELAKDLAQDAFFSYFQNREKISEDENAIRSYLYTSIKYAVYNNSRKDKVIEKYWQKNHFKECDDIDFENNIIKSEFIVEINRIVSELPVSCQKIFRLGYLDGWSNQEISKALDLSVNTVKTQKRRGLKVVQSKLNPEFLLVFVVLFLK